MVEGGGESRILKKQLIFYNWINHLFYYTFSNKYQPIIQPIQIFSINVC